MPVDWFFCFFCRLLRLIEEISDSDVSLVCIERLFFLRTGVICGADTPCQNGCVGGALIGWKGLKCNLWVRSSLFWNASSCFGFFLGIRTLRALDYLLVVEIQDQHKKNTLTSSGCFMERLI